MALHQYGKGYVVAVMADDGVGTTKRITWEKDGSKMALIPLRNVLFATLRVSATVLTVCLMPPVQKS